MNILPKQNNTMKPYPLTIVLEPEHDFDGNPTGWSAFCPSLIELGGSAWGTTQEEALKGINHIIYSVVQEVPVASVQIGESF